jgi:peptide/nickel transport system ATP-binding protein
VGHAVLLITHDLAVARQVSHRIAVMHNGRIVEAGPARQVLTTPGPVYTQKLLAAVPGAATRGRWLATPGDVAARKVIVADRRPLLEVDDVSLSFTRPDGSSVIRDGTLPRAALGSPAAWV